MIKLNAATIMENKTMVKDTKNRTITVQLIEEEGPNKGMFSVTLLDKKTNDIKNFVMLTIGEVSKKYDYRDWEPVIIETKKEKKVKKTKEITPDDKEPQGDDVVTLKTIIEELIAEKILPESLKMKKVRRILRNHQEELQDKSAKKGEAFRWAWVTSEKESLKKDITELLK